MRNKRLLRQLYPAFLLVLLIALGVLGWYVLITFRNFYLTQAAEDLAARARFFESQVQGRWSDPDPGALDSLSKAVGRKTSTRITLILPNGKVIADSEEDPQNMDNHAARPEVKEALAGEVGKSIRFSRTLQKNMIYLALPVMDEGGVAGLIRTAVPITEVDRVLGVFRNRMLLGMVLIALLAAVVSLIVSQRISRPLKAMRRGAERFARGELDYRLAVPDAGEIGSLAVSLNRMASQLKDRVDTIGRQGSEQQALLSAMVESVLAVNMERQIISMNQAACRMLGVSLEEAKGRNLQEIVRNIDLQRFVETVLDKNQAAEADLVLYTGEEQYLQGHGTILRDAEGRNKGVLIVLNDVTRLRRLENARRDFFSNVSHEIRTPITAIKGYVETLLDGEPRKPEDEERFLKVISRQSDRLNALIDDFLALSNIEQGAERGILEIQSGRLADLLQSAVQACETKASERNIVIELECDPGIEVRFNPGLMEQAVQNLIDNAIKYSEPGGSVRVDGARAGSFVTIEVADCGIGIAKEDQSRIFERLYRVDKARSRRLGGTGLGLAIVKHIVQAHGGRVTVKSTLGAGSTFTIRLPAEPGAE